MESQETPLDKEELRIATSNPDELHVNKLLYSIITCGTGLTQLQKLLAEFNTIFERNYSL